MAKQQIDMTKMESMWNALWKAVRESSKGLKPEEVVDCMFQASKQIWEAGLDEIYDATEGRLDQSDGMGWDFIWLSSWLFKLNEKHEKKTKK